MPPSSPGTSPVPTPASPRPTPAQPAAHGWAELRRRSGEIPWVLAGGFLGTLARYCLGLLGDPLWILIAINCVGCFLLGTIFALRRENRLSPRDYAFWGTGVVGSFTTFSGVMVLLAVPAAHLLTWLAVIASIVVGILLALVGSWLVRWVVSKPDRKQNRGVAL